MYLQKYKMLVSPTRMTYEFYSEGPKGKIKKIVQYERLKNPNRMVFNLIFGDWDERNQRISDKLISNNSDRDKILRTVAETVLMFTSYFGEAIIYIEGSTPSRTRLYQMNIALFKMEISNMFDIYGFIKGIWEEFEAGKNYEAFLVKRKRNL